MNEPILLIGTSPPFSLSGSQLESGALILVEDTRYRVRRLPIGRR